MSSYLIYKHTSPDGKAYIGYTKNYAKRCNDHKNGNKCRLLQLSIQQYGWDNFKHEILKDNLTLEEAHHWEKFYISHHNTLHPNGYNLTTGAKGCRYSQESKEKMSKATKGRASWNKGKKLSITHRKKLSQTRTGLKQSSATIEKRVSKLRGKKRDPVMMEKLRLISVGRKYSTETLRRMSEGQKRRFARIKAQENQLRESP